MSTYTDASLIYYPSGYKAGTAYSLKPTDGSGDLTFTRASTATRVNESGLIEEVAANVPRLDNSQGGCSTLLLEPQRTNLIQYSEDFSQGYWTKSGSSVVSGFVSPKGDLSAFKMVESATTGSHIIISPTIIKAASSLDYSFSLFAKKGERDFLAYRIDAGASNGCYVCFNLSNGTISTSATLSGTGFTNASAKITLLGSGFYKCSISFNTNTQTIIRVIKSVQQTTGNPFTYSSTGDGTSGIYIYGASLEQGSYPTSYIPTSGTAVTRTQDSASKTGITSFLSSSSGCLFFNFGANNQQNSAVLGGLINGDWGTSIITRVESVGLLRVDVINGFTLLFSYISNVQINNSKIAISWVGGVLKIYINGLLKQTSGSITIPSINQLILQGGQSAALLNYSQVLLFPTNLSDTDAIALTTL